AETCIAAHWRYKNNRTLSPEATDLITKLQQDVSDKQMGSIIMGDVNLDSLSEEVITYTPQGHLARLPSGATVLDFAFHIHTEVGLHFKEALVNRQNVVMGHQLVHGDEVEIITDPETRPEEYWKRYATTQRALSGIQQALSAEALRYFENFVLDIARQLDVVLVTKIDINIMRRVFKRLGVKDLKSLEEGLVKVQILPQEILHAVKPNLKIDQSRQKTGKNTIETKDFGYIVRRCHFCQPLPGDRMYGVSVINKGTIAHRTDCHAFSPYLDTHCFIEDVSLERAGIGTYQEYPVLLDCTMTHRAGMLGLIATAIGDRGINIQGVECIKRDDRHYSLRFDLLVQHKSQIDGIEKTVRARASDSIEISRPILPAKLTVLDECDED
ncbi:MAG: bifunctional (p)ppGpp synthetase/guanosine-3',5'-bis(diphosphate) 3'-pyrophosphohydrolase, partial [Alphaproteobacteria bacterium]|nr:bifunctional (p)ppGpp synthetase/guanosine-3',5'-bis(diphosphate) 3'-pyrophosphohydrolase [Alphaproteobacteria bacterium]